MRWALRPRDVVTHSGLFLRISFRKLSVSGIQNEKTTAKVDQKCAYASFLAFLTTEALENFNDFWQFFGSWFIYSISEWNSLFQVTV